MGNIMQSQGKAITTENPKTIFDRLIQTTVSEALIADAIEIYAESSFDDDVAREDFIEKYGDAQYEPIIKKAVLDIVVSVVAAHTVDSDDTFLSILNMLEIEEEDDVIRKMKLAMLAKMIDDATSDMSDDLEHAFKRRMQITEKAIG